MRGGTVDEDAPMSVWSHVDYLVVNTKAGINSLIQKRRSSEPQYPAQKGAFSLDDSYSDRYVAVARIIVTNQMQHS
jgi:hypothetical protein